MPRPYQIGDRFAAGKSYIAKMIMAAEIFRQAMIRLEPKLTSQGGKQAGGIVIATVKGDIHDLGKKMNALATLLAGTSSHC